MDAWVVFIIFWWLDSTAKYDLSMSSGTTEGQFPEKFSWIFAFLFDLYQSVVFKVSGYVQVWIVVFCSLESLAQGWGNWTEWRIELNVEENGE